MHDHVTPGGGQEIQPCAEGGLQAMDMASEQLCSRERAVHDADKQLLNNK